MYSHDNGIRPSGHLTEIYYNIKCTRFANYNLKVATKEKEQRQPPSARTRGLYSNAEFQPCEPPMWPQFFVSNCPIYSHGWATILQPLRTTHLKDLYDGALKLV